MTTADSDSFVEFLQAYRPTLEAGRYQITVSQTVTGAAAPYATTRQFLVAGPRFTLDPTLIHSFYPPPNHQGHFANYLPQIVFNRKSLPWERSQDGTPPDPRPGVVPPPWLGILLFNENDPGWPIRVQTRPVSDLIAKADGGTREPTVFGPALTKTDVQLEGQDLTDKLLAIDIPAALFPPVAPVLADLPFTAHARLIDSRKKVIPAPHNLDGWVSVVIGNRFCQPKARNQAYLVSFEKVPLTGASVPSPCVSVRLVCLASWHFTDLDEKESFKELVRKLDRGRLALVPGKPAPSGPAQDVQSNLLAGYTAFNHTTRQGEKTVSWNRGPFVPLGLTPPASLPNYSSADKALKYDPATGLFDVSYAAAWQIGRLLGLNDRQFSTTLFAWRRSINHRAATAVTRMLLHARLGPAISLTGPPEDPVPRQVVKDGILGFLANRVAPQLTDGLGTREGQPLLGDFADPSGLRGFVGKVEGLLAPEEITRILTAPGDPITAIRDRLFGGGPEHA